MTDASPVATEHIGVTPISARCGLRLANECETAETIAARIPDRMTQI
ncbi:hypothetical protein [Tateyamaria pelophila]|nr:hypothetical protein [Tateyamaria pelophila]